jgi:diguanylate cyclase (GGDEF)-like protein
MNRILLLLDHVKNSQLLADWLAPDYDVIVGKGDAALDEAFDLAIIDGPALERLGIQLHARRASEAPVLLPLLLVTPLRRASLVARQLWQSVDDVIGTPILKAELQVRLQVLLRQRKLSLELKTSHEAQLRHIAHHDPLTDLPNRLLFVDRLRDALARARAERRLLAVVLLDLDRFTAINESYGHAFGDLLLQAVAERLAAQLPRDALAHFGGDTFALSLSELARLPDAALLGQRLLADLARPFILLGHTVYTAASLGITLYPFDADDHESLLDNAGTAMYRAKKEGGSTYQFFTPQMKAQVLDRLDLETRLRGAAERGELVLEYQPQVELASGRIVGFEALARWNEPMLGAIAPNRFISVAEETDLVERLGEWALEATCRQNKAWQEAGLPPVRAAVNVSARHFRHGVEKIVARVLAESGLDSRYLEVEITESSVMEFTPEAVETLQKLRELGVHLSIDDFGTGYSSMSYLKRLPVATLKIDRSFVRDIARDADSQAIVQAIIAVAHSLKLNVIAEGVETAEQLANLRARGCDQVQGFVFSRPLSADAFARLLRKGEPLPAADYGASRCPV